MDAVRYIKVLHALLILALSCPSPGFADEEEPSLTIERYSLEGNSLLTPEETEAATQPFLGEHRHFADLQKAVAAIMDIYRVKGYDGVLATLPEQELSGGVVKIKVIEPVLKSIDIQYTDPNLRNYYPESSILESLPDLKISKPLHTGSIADNLQLTNENPGKQTSVVLNNLDEPGQMGAGVRVDGSPPRKAYMTLDNTGTDKTGEYRVGFGLQHANFWNMDHVATLNYITPIDRPGQVNIFSVNYHAPLYDLGNSLDINAALSDARNTTTTTAAGPLQFSGKGSIYALNYNRLLSRWGEYSHRIITGLNYKQFVNNCSIGDFGPQSCGPSSQDITLLPYSLGYNGQYNHQQHNFSFYLTSVQNIPGLPHGGQNDFNLIRPGSLGTGGAPANYILYKGGYNYSGLLPADWQIRLAGNSQYSRAPLVYAEQFSLAGNAMVRGFWEREATRDIGYVLNAELYGPNLASELGFGDYLRGMLFFDYGKGHNNTLPGDTMQFIALSSTGLGLRFGFKESLQLKIDAAYVLDGATSHTPGDVRAHLALYLPYSF